MRILLLLFFATLQIGIAKGSTTIEQFNHLLTSEHVLGGKDRSSAQWDVCESRNGHDNFALVYVEGSSILISSSIINSSLYKLLQDKDISSDQPAISVMDLLYFYKSTFDSSLIEGSLFEKVNSARINPNREIIIQMLKLVVSNFMAHKSKSSGDIFYNVQKKYFNTGELEKIEFVNESAEKVLPLIRLINFVSEGITEDLNSKRVAIIDFLQRLKLYTTEVPSIPDEIIDRNGDSEEENVLVYTSHQETDKQILLREIDQQLQEIPSEENITSLSLAKSIVNLVRLIRGPNLKIGDIWRCGSGNQYPEHHNPNQYVSAITHTEQIVDWFQRHFHQNILVKISGKTPCVKCSHYIKYAQDVIQDWNARTILGYTVGWSGRNPMLECMQYRYPIKVFNASSVNTALNPWTLILDAPRSILTRKLLEIPGTYDESDFGTHIGIDLAHCYAIENVNGVQCNEEGTRYKGQLTIQLDGSIVQIKTDREADSLLIPYTPLPHADNSSEEETVE